MLATLPERNTRNQGAGWFVSGWLLCLLSLVNAGLLLSPNENLAQADEGGKVRIATFNSSLYREQAGQLIQDLQDPSNSQPRQIAEIIQRVRPDVLLLNEFDYDAEGQAADLFQRNFLEVGQNGQEPLRYPHRFLAPSNTGIPTGMDMNRNGKTDGPNDAIGYGKFPGQYGMLLLSKYPIDQQQARTFQKFLWKDMPNAKLPRVPGTEQPWYSDEQLAVLRLSSKNHWAVPILVADETRIWALASHPTPPVFDGPEDRNGLRNHDEIRFWADFIDPLRSTYIVDDQGRQGGLPPKAQFVILGDQNADPWDGDSTDDAILQLTRHPLINDDTPPRSEGGPAAAKASPRQNSRHRGDPAHDTSNFSEGNGPGNLRVDYALPSRNLTLLANGVFWPLPGEPGAELIDATDHRLVWIDIQLQP